MPPSQRDNTAHPKHCSQISLSTLQKSERLIREWAGKCPAPMTDTVQYKCCFGNNHLIQHLGKYTICLDLACAGPQLPRSNFIWAKNEGTQRVNTDGCQQLRRVHLIRHHLLKSLHHFCYPSFLLADPIQNNSKQWNRVS